MGQDLSRPRAFQKYDDFDVNYDYSKPRYFPSERLAWQRSQDQYEPPTTSQAEPITKSEEADPYEVEVEEFEEPPKEIENIFIHVHDEEGRYYTDLTTFHGMRRIFVAETWPSRLFWCAVVVNCLVFYMLYSGQTISNYRQRSSFMMRTSRTSISPYNDMKFKFCKQNLRLNCSHFSINAQSRCSEELNGCVILRDFLFGHNHPLRHVKTRIRINHTSTGYARIPLELRLFLGDSLASRQFLSYSRSNRLNLRMRKVRCEHICEFRKLIPPDEGGNCAESWSLMDFPIEFLPKVAYSLRNCEHLRLSLYYFARNGCIPKGHRHIFRANITECPKVIEQKGKDIQEIQGFKCRPECERVDLKSKVEKLFSKRIQVTSMNSTLEVVMDTQIEERIQTRKMGVTDVLSLIGGATSLFLGCSCVTLMEMFIYLFKSTTSVVTKKVPERGTFFEMDKRLFESTSITKRRRGAASIVIEEEISLNDSRRSTRKISVVPLSPVRRLSTFSFSQPARHSMRKEVRSDSLSSTQTVPPHNRPSRLEEPSTSREWTTDSSFEKRRAPPLRQLKENVTFNRHSSHSIERIVRNLPVEKRMSMDMTDEGKYLCRQTAVDIPDEELKEYFADNGLEYPEKETKPSVNEKRNMLHAVPSETGSTRSSISHRSIRSARGGAEVAVIHLVHDQSNSQRRRSSNVYHRKMPMGDL